MDDLPVAVLSGGSLSYIEPDHLGTPRVAIDAASNTANWRWPLLNDPFGEGQPGGALRLDLRFPGQVYDAESGMNYNYFRDYDPGTGRYVESDPIGLAGGLATYGYSGGNTLTAYDRYGLCWGVLQFAAHYYTGNARTVTLGEIGCSSIVGSKIQPERNIWISKIRTATKQAAYAMQCGTWKRITAARSVGVSSGIYWIGGFSLLQDSNCVVGKQCGGSNGMQCLRDSYSFDCLLTSRMHDLTEDVLDLDNTGRTGNPDFWDHWKWGGREFYVDGYWSDSISGSGQL